MSRWKPSSRLSSVSFSSYSGDLFRFLPFLLGFCGRFRWLSPSHSSRVALGCGSTIRRGLYAASPTRFSLFFSKVAALKLDKIASAESSSMSAGRFLAGCDEPARLEVGGLGRGSTTEVDSSPWLFRFCSARTLLFPLYKLEIFSRQSLVKSCNWPKRNKASC